MNFSEKLQQTLGKSIKDAANEEIYAALLSTVKEAAADKGKRRCLPRHGADLRSDL